MISESVKNEAKELIKDYKYVQQKLLGDKLRIYKYDKDYLEVVIKNYFSHDNLENKNGTCSELMNAFYNQFKGLHPNIAVLRAKGKDPNFFSSESDIHWFNILAKKDSLPNFIETKDAEILSSILSANPAIVDASFNYVGDYFKSGYTLNKILNENVPKQYSNSRKLWAGSEVPVFLQDNGLMLKLGIASASRNNPKESKRTDFISARLQAPNDNLGSTYHMLDSPYFLKQIENHPTSKAIITALLNASIININEPLNTFHDIVVV